MLLWRLKINLFILGVFLVKTILSINLGNFGSTGNIMRGISKAAEQSGYTCWQAYAPDRNNGIALERDIVIESYNVRRLNELYSRYTGMRGFQAYFSTKAFLKKVDKIKPDIIHLHNLHNNYIHVGLLFDYIKKNRIKVVWTLHDCWAFTGRCPYFQMSGCKRWKTGCHDCPYPKEEYPSVRVDKSDVLWKMKKAAFTGVENLTIVTPSEWLAGLVKESFLKEYPVQVIYNGIDLDVFKPTPSDFRSAYGIGGGVKVLLGVSFNWEKRKGLDVFIELSKMLDNRYKIVLVGIDAQTGKTLPENILTIERTRDKRELAQIYTAANIFVNPTREEALGMVNLEALACGTPVVTFRTGGSPECIDDTCGVVVACDDIQALKTAIEEMAV
jgi:glycosyltransferase involved in cell wall biosynthesis